MRIFRQGKTVERCCGGVVPKGHKYSYAAQSITKTYAALAEKSHLYSVIAPV